MSYDIRVKNRKDGNTVVLKSKHGIKGGTYCVGGTEYAELNITYNYSKWFYELWPETENDKGGIRSLYGKPLDEAISELNRAVNTLRGERDEDYWEATEGNARDALFNLKLLCEMARFENPDEDLTLDGD